MPPNSDERSEPQRGELYWIEWEPGTGSEQAGRRPGLVVQTDLANEKHNYRLTIVVAVSSTGRAIPFHVRLDPSETNGLTNVSYVKCEHIQTVSKDRLIRRIGKIRPQDIDEVDRAMKRVLSLR